MAERLFYSMGEVSEMFDVNPSLLRHWETQFSILRPKRNKKGNRLYSPADVEHLKLINHLVETADRKRCRATWSCWNGCSACGRCWSR